MHLGLYDIDLWHTSQKVFPNLELAKVANYHRQKGDMVTMLTPKTMDIGRFDKIIYFKERYNANNRNLKLTTPKTEIYGQGFYGKFYPLDDKYNSSPPSYLIYEPYFDKLVKSFETLKNNSHIRIENRDLTYFHKEKSKIYVADINYFNTDNPFDFLEEYKNYYFYFIHGAKVNNSNDLSKFNKYQNIFLSDIILNYNYDEETFKNYCLNYHFFCPIGVIRDYEDEQEALCRAAAQILYLKTYNLTTIRYNHFSTELGKAIMTWGGTKTQESFVSYYSNSKAISNAILLAPAQLRSYLKTSPKKIKSSQIDFTDIL